MPKSMVVDPSFAWGDEQRPGVPWSKTVIYEAHLRGVSMRHPEVRFQDRGTFAGIASDPILEHLNKIGITAIELLPVQAFFDEPHLIAQGLANYWGYNSIGFFAPEPRYQRSDGVRDFQRMVHRFHDAGIEVLLDVVYNHTAEGNQLGPTLSFRGIDNASYYRLLPDTPRYYINDTGCGNTVNVNHPRVLQMVMDSLRYWVEVMHVDGFRFDLAPVLGREDHGFDPHGGFFDALRQDPVLAGVKLIAEPWDVGPGGYQLGGFPPGFAEWNDRYRDIVRRFWRGDEGMLPDLARGLLGSSELFDHQGRRAFASVNFITSHDGFTAHDLVAYDHKHNDANGEDNRDGHNGNHSWNHGIEGPTSDPEIRELRARQTRNMLATIFLSQGTPMLLAGDEMANSQRGNNNAYCQDNEIAWLNWDSADRGMIGAVQKLIAFRQQHPLLRQPHFLHGRDEGPLGLKDVTWITHEGVERLNEDWQRGWERVIGLMLAGQGALDGSETLLIAMNAFHEEIDFVLPTIDGAKASWRVALDTGLAELAPDMTVEIAMGKAYLLPGRTVMVFDLIAGPTP